MNIFNDNVLLARHSISKMRLEQASNDLLTFILLPVELISSLSIVNKNIHAENKT